MYITGHAGGCCGIKTIWNMGYDPNGWIPAKTASKVGNINYDQVGRRSLVNYFHEAAPAEKYHERLDRLLAFLDKKRPRGIVEVVVADYGGTLSGQARAWKPYLLERGFKQVNECLNSNSGNKVYVYHRNSGEVEKMVLKEKKA